MCPADTLCSQHKGGSAIATPLRWRCHVGTIGKRNAQEDAGLTPLGLCIRPMD